MKLTYHKQMMVMVAMILVGNGISTMLQHWALRSAGFVICGLLLVFHPVLPESIPMTEKSRLWVRVAGALLIYLGVFTRTYYF